MPVRCWPIFCVVLTFVVVALLSSTRAAEVAAPTFEKAGVPFLTKHCIKCHGADMPKADLSLHAFKDAASVLKGRKRWETVLEMVEAGEMPPPKQPQPTADERMNFVRSVRALFEKADNTGQPDPGQITVRRLNRAEYNNTVRDLLGVDFQPAEDFPADDVGYGFDNIGDVLSVSPILMERYLAAAETIAQRVIVVDPPAPPKRYLSAKYLQPAGSDVPQGRFRPLEPADANPRKSGPFFGADYFKFAPDGEHTLRARLYAKTEGKQPVKVALFISGKNLAQTSSEAEIETLMGVAIKQVQPLKILQTFEITAREEKKAQQIEVPVNRITGIERVGLAVIKPAGDEPPPTIYIEHLMTEGPMDTRPAFQRTMLASSADKPQAERTREVLGKLLLRAYRRPPSQQEIDGVATFVEQTVAASQKWEAGMQLAIQAVLCSPKFLFRVELDNGRQSKSVKADEAYPIDEYQLASRLSYFIWSSMPDDELFELAGRGQLSVHLEPQVRRMLNDPKANSLVDNFAMQWLQLGKLQSISPDKTAFPSFNEPLRQAMLTETRLFLQEIVREDRSVLDLIQSDFTYVNEQLSRHYGIIDTLGNRSSDKPKQRGQPIRGPQFVRVPLVGDDRGGLLTQASVLTVTSNPTRTSPVKRGRWVLEQILGTPPPPPPPNVPELDKEKGELTGTLRQRMEQHRANPACANCHARMDPIGFAFENYNAIGGLRQKDGAFDIDPSGVLPDGRKIQGPQDLKQVLLDKKELFTRSLAEKMMTYALGRGLEYYDKRAIDRTVLAVAQDQFKFSRLVIAIAQSDPFRLRKAPEQTP